MQLSPYTMDTMIEPSLALYGEAFERVEQHLDELLTATGVRYCLLVDRKGFVISHKEALWAPRPPALDSVATLIASNAAATGALASMLGERAFNEQIHQGENVTLYVEAAGDNALLGLIFDNSVPLGRVKVYTKKSLAQITDLLKVVQDAPAVKFDDEFASSAGALLDDLLG
ncbi:Roadblock/LC7 family protein [Deinococcus maricopensis DSM 21211]|uniref:Roadblock/LC7 family protein n=2 Tax=Deinococcus TaxID=1298 RepID=E8U3J5_DEIML|nr:Roadblock/LC7 family protein [Deinococcus maricopensis DSM 21211]